MTSVCAGIYEPEIEKSYIPIQTTWRNKIIGWWIARTENFTKLNEYVYIWRDSSGNGRDARSYQIFTPSVPQFLVFHEDYIECSAFPFVEPKASLIDLNNVLSFSCTFIPLSQANYYLFGLVRGTPYMENYIQLRTHFADIFNIRVNWNKITYSLETKNILLFEFYTRSQELFIYWNNQLHQTININGIVNGQITGKFYVNTYTGKPPTANEFDQYIIKGKVYEYVVFSAALTPDERKEFFAERLKDPIPK